MNKPFEVALISTAGALGGLVSVLDSWADPVSYPLTLSKLASLLLIPLIKGGVAAGVGVYLLTTVDPTNFVRAFFFAVTCGLTFPAVLTSGTSYAQRVTSEVANKEVAHNVEKLQSVAAAVPQSASSPALPASAVAQIREASVAIVQATPKVSPTEARAADAVVQQAVMDLARTSNVAIDSTTVDAIGKIGNAAASQNLPLSRDTALKELNAIKGNAAVTQPVRDSAFRAAQQVERTTATTP